MVNKHTHTLAHWHTGKESPVLLLVYHKVCRRVPVPTLILQTLLLVMVVVVVVC